MDRDAWNERYSGADLVWTAEPNRFLVEEVSSLPPGSALDLGAGEGRNAVWLASQGWQVTAVDFSDTALAKAHLLAAAAGVDVTTVCEDVAVYRPPPGGFDLVALLYLHLPAQLRSVVYRKAGECVAPGGTLLIVGHDATNLAQGYGGPQDPDLLWSPDDVVADLIGVVLTIEKAVRVQRPLDTDQGQRVAIDALVRARRPGGSG